MTNHTETPVALVPSLAELAPGSTGEFFARIASREHGTTRDGKPYYRISFQDASTALPAMIWNDSPFFDACHSEWKRGDILRVTGRHTASLKFGSQLELLAVRPVSDDDRAAGFNVEQLYRSTHVHPADLFDTLLGYARKIVDPALRALVTYLYKEQRDDLLRWPAASRNHHAFPGGYLEHVLSVTETAYFLATKYHRDYPQVDLSVDLVLAGAMLHDIGKLQELTVVCDMGEYTAPGRLIGHLLLGRDMVRAAAGHYEHLDSETLLRLEHIIVSHQGQPEWGSPIAPATPEALLVHYADDTDAKFHIAATALERMTCPDDQFTNRDNPLRRPFYRGPLNSLVEHP